MNNFARTAGAAGIALIAMAGSALADGYGSGGSSKDAPADEGRKLTWSITLGATSDYVFRGLSLSDERPAAQGSFDIGYGIFYAGVWSSNLDDGLAKDVHDGVGAVEIDLYAGIKPVVGPVTFDLGIIGYLYPNENYNGIRGQAEYLELKAGASFAPFKDATLGGTIYYSPEYQYTDGDSFAIEGTAGYTFHQVGPFVPTISGTFGYQEIEEAVNRAAALGFAGSFGGGDNNNDYLYWNAGLALVVDKFTIDLRYWDTDIKNDSVFLAHGLTDERFVGTVKVTLP